MSVIINWRWEMFSLIAGVFLTLACAPFDYWYLAVVSLGIIFLSWLNTSPGRAALRGYLYGLGLFGSGIYWVYISVHDYGGAPAIGAVMLTVLAVCFWAIFPALTAWLSVKICGSKHKKRLLWVIPFVWVIVEYLRGYWVLNGFPWFQIAYTQLELPLKGFVPIVGVYGTGFILALSVSFLVAGFLKNIKYRYSVFFILLLWGVGAFLETIKWTERIEEPINVALIQGNISQDQKWLAKNRINILLRYQQMTTQNWDADIIVWPETAIPAYLSQVKEFYLDPLSKQAKEQNTDLIVSLPVLGAQKNEYFNSVITLGKREGRYNKRHLLPFGEYLPLQPFSGYVLSLLKIPLGNFTAGDINQELLQAGGYPFSTSICYEDAFGEGVIQDLPEAAFLVNVTNDAWFGASIELQQHMQIAQMRALETGRYMLRTTNTGVTAIIAPDGLIVKKAPLFKQAVLKGQIYPMRGMTPYAEIGDKIIILILLLCLASLIIYSKLNRDK